jgi:pimeloyl-ACP methyl ester carboxylesterase
MAMTPTEASTSKYIQAGPARLHYNEVGEGPALICLHGGGPGASGWSNFEGNIPALSKRYRMLMVDLPQFGKSEKLVITGPRLSSYAAIMRDYLDAMGIERAHFLGNSFGGQVSVKLAIDFPDRIDRMAIIGSTPVSQSLMSPMPAEGVRLIMEYYKGEGPTMAKMQQLLRTLVYDHSLLTEDVIRARYEASADPEVIELHKKPRPIPQDLTSELSKVKCPSLVIWGLDDRAGPLDIGILMTRMFQNARMHTFTRCGHWAQVERRDEFNQLVLNFLSGPV